MNTPDLQALIELSEKATPGPWGWRNRHGQIEIAAPHGGGTIVMGFVRDGMRNAQPVFGVSLDGLPRGKRGGVLRSAKDLIADDPDGELSHPDAQFMVAAANYVRELLTAPTLPGAGGGDNHVAIGWIRPGQDFTEASPHDDVSLMMDRGWQPVALIPPSAVFSLPPQQGG